MCTQFSTFSNYNVKSIQISWITCTNSLMLFEIWYSEVMVFDVLVFEIVNYDMVFVMH